MRPRAPALPAIALALALVASVAGCRTDRHLGPGLSSAPPAGVVNGQLLMVGGPSPGMHRPLSGTITLRGKQGSVEARAGNDGRYTVELLAGVYELEGRSPRYGTGKCLAASPVAVVPSRTVRIDVLCQVI